jgi:hypothetical protein
MNPVGFNIPSIPTLNKIDVPKYTYNNTLGWAVDTFTKGKQSNVDLTNSDLFDNLFKQSNFKVNQ